MLEHPEVVTDRLADLLARAGAGHAGGYRGAVMETPAAPHSPAADPATPVTPALRSR